jgi:hypothetical protein
MSTHTMKTLITLLLVIFVTTADAQKRDYVHHFFERVVEAYPMNVRDRNESCVMLVKFVKTKDRKEAVIINGAPQQYIDWLNLRLKEKMKSFDFSKVKLNDVLPIVLLGREDQCSGGGMRALVDHGNIAGLFKNASGLRFLDPLIVSSPIGPDRTY